MTERTVTIGDKTYTIQRFRALRAILVSASLTRITQDMPDFVAQASKDYSAKHSVTITEQMTKLPRYAGFTSEDFDAAEQKTGKREIELPSQANGTEALLAALPRLLESSVRREVQRLFAILLITNAELREADKNDRIDEALDAYAEIIMFDAEIDELFDIAEAGMESIKLLDPKRRETMGKAIRRLLGSVNLSLPQMPNVSAPAQDSQQNTSTPQTSAPDAPISSPDLPSPSDGAEMTPSMASLGAR